MVVVVMQPPRAGRAAATPLSITFASTEQGDFRDPEGILSAVQAGTRSA